MLINKCSVSGFDGSVEVYGELFSQYHSILPSLVTYLISDIVGSLYYRTCLSPCNEVLSNRLVDKHYLMVYCFSA